LLHPKFLVVLVQPDLPNTRCSMRTTRELDFFINTELAYQRLKHYAQEQMGDPAMLSLRRGVMDALDFAHDLPLQRMNETLKRYPFVDPSPLDNHLVEMMEAVSDWFLWVTQVDWLVDVAHRIGEMDDSTRALLVSRAQAAARHEQVDGQMEVQFGNISSDLDLEQMGRFTYPVPLKLRDLQAMLRPFMEVGSVHHVAGLDSITSELARSILRLFLIVRAWDDCLVSRIGRVAVAESCDDSIQRVEALLELSAMCDFDVFNAAFRLHRIDRTLFRITDMDIENVCHKLPLFADQRMLNGTATAAMDHGLCGASATSTISAGAQRLAHDLVKHSSASRQHSLEERYDDPPSQALIAMRSKALVWWRNQGFSYGAPTMVLANALLQAAQNPESPVEDETKELLPVVLAGLFGPQMTCRSFMNKFLPAVGGYMGDDGEDVPLGEGLPFHDDPECCAASLDAFVCKWKDLVLAAEEERAARALQPSPSPNSNLADLVDDGHSCQDVIELLEGAKPLPQHVLEGVTHPGRYGIDEQMLQNWELANEKFQDDLDLLEKRSRDLGPYVHIKLDGGIEEIAHQVGPLSEGTWCLVNPDVAQVALRKQTYASTIQSEYDDDPAEFHLPKRPLRDASDSLALELAEWPEELDSSAVPSTFIRSYGSGGRRASRSACDKNGNGSALPTLPWSFGTDPRNTVVMDLERQHGIAPFHCLFARSRQQPHRAVVMALGDPMSDSYIVCPKYQPIQVRNGDRLVCHQWTFQVRTESGDDHRDHLSILTDEGECFKVPLDGCHVGAGSRSRKTDYQPSFPSTKFILTHRLKNMAAVHVVFRYMPSVNKWAVIDHSPEPLGALLALRPGVAYPLSEGLRLKLGPLILRVGQT